MQIASSKQAANQKARNINSVGNQPIKVFGLINTTHYIQLLARH